MSAIQCRHCQVEMQEREGVPGHYVCPINPEHTYQDHAAQTAGPVPEAGDPARRSYTCESVSFEPQATEVNRDRSYMLTLIKHCGLFGPVGWVPQASQAGDGRLGYGPSPKKGGSRSGRKRKKKREGGKTHTDEPRTEGGTNSK